MTQRTLLKLRQWRMIIISWLIIGLLIAIYENFVLHTTISAGPAADYSFVQSVLINMGAGLTGALLGGSFLVFFVNVRFQDKPYGYTIVAVTTSFVGVIMLVNWLLSTFVNMDTSRLYKNGMVWAVVVAITQLLLQVNSKFGPGVYWKLIWGQYNTPREEKRIFMFLDINSSTAIAESLGDKRYHALLKDFFTDITNPILDNKGEIYQYVGDEVIIAWKYEDGVKNNKCIQCFFDIKEELQRKGEKYIRDYGLIPSFKAGMHCGKVVAGEVGIIKRDITYSGDVLNTTSRIQAMCKQFNAEVIASADLMEELKYEGRYFAETLGCIKLRGKEKEMMLLSLSRSTSGMVTRRSQ